MENTTIENQSLGLNNESMDALVGGLEKTIEKTMDMYRAIECVLEAYIHIQPQAIGQIVDHYFEIVAEAYKDNKSTAAQYIGYVYSEIIATEKDPFELRARIEAIRKADDKYDIEKVASEIKISRALSR